MKGKNMKKYKLQHQMPDFQSVDEISLKKV